MVDVHLSWLNWFHFLILMGGLPVIIIDCMIFLSPILDVRSRVRININILNCDKKRPKAPFKSTNCPSPPFKAIPPYILVFHEPPPPPKNQSFQWTPIIFKFFILITRSNLLKVTKFLVKISILVAILSYDREKCFCL